MAPFPSFPALSIPADLPEPHQVFLGALDALAEALDRVATLAPPRVQAALKKAKDFGATVRIGHDPDLRAPHHAPKVKLYGYKDARSFDAPWVAPEAYGKKTEGQTAHAFMARPVVLFDALMLARQRAAEASLAMGAVPYMGATTLLVQGAPRPKHSPHPRIGLVIDQTALEDDRLRTEDATTDCQWSDTKGARPHLVAYLRRIALLPPLAPDAPYWTGERHAPGKAFAEVIQAKPHLAWNQRYVQANTAQDAATLLEAQHRLLRDRGFSAHPHPWVVHKAEMVLPLQIP